MLTAVCDCTFANPTILLHDGAPITPPPPPDARSRRCSSRPARAWPSDGRARAAKDVPRALMAHVAGLRVTNRFPQAWAAIGSTETLTLAFASPCDLIFSVTLAIRASHIIFTEYKRLGEARPTSRTYKKSAMRLQFWFCRFVWQRL
jgi:hypothetical protein